MFSSALSRAFGLPYSGHGPGAVSYTHLDDFFASDQQAVAVADRYPQDVFAEHTHDFCELVIVWRGNGPVSYTHLSVPVAGCTTRRPDKALVPHPAINA